MIKRYILFKYKVIIKILNLNIKRVNINIFKILRYKYEKELNNGKDE